MRACRRPQIAEYKLQKVPNYHRKWLDIENNPSINIIISAARTMQNVATGPGLIVYATEGCFYAMGATQIIR